MSIQPFKATDPVEAKVTEAFSPILSVLGEERDSFYEGKFEAFDLGRVIYDLGRDPVAGPVSRDIYASSYPAIHTLFTRPGTFEFYLDVFRAIWGDTVDVEFVVPAPGKLEINIEALGISEDFFMSRSIVEGGYTYDEVIDDESDNIVFQVPIGIRTQQQTEALIRELSPAGLWIEATLTIP